MEKNKKCHLKRNSKLWPVKLILGEKLLTYLSHRDFNKKNLKFLKIILDYTLLKYSSSRDWLRTAINEKRHLKTPKKVIGYTLLIKLRL